MFALLENQTCKSGLSLAWHMQPTHIFCYCFCRVTFSSGYNVTIVSCNVAHLTGVQDRHLFVNGERASRTRLPDTTGSALFAGAQLTDFGYALKVTHALLSGCSLLSGEVCIQIELATTDMH